MSRANGLCASVHFIEQQHQIHAASLTLVTTKVRQRASMEQNA